MELLVLFALGVAALVILPVLLVKLVIGLVLLPFKLLGLFFRIGFGLVAAIGSVLMVLAGVVLGGLILAALAILIPLLPLALIVGVIWLAVRASRPQTTAIRAVR